MFCSYISKFTIVKWGNSNHIVFVPKYRRKVIYGKLRTDIGAILRQLCAYKDVEIIEAHVMPDHIHMLVKIPPKMSVSNFMEYLKNLRIESISSVIRSFGQKDILFQRSDLIQRW